MPDLRQEYWNGDVRLAYIFAADAVQPVGLTRSARNEFLTAAPSSLDASRRAGACTLAVLAEISVRARDPIAATAVRAGKPDSILRLGVLCADSREIMVSTITDVEGI